LYSILRFVVEFFRGDAARGVYFGGYISTSQIISLLSFALSLFMLWWLGRTQTEAGGTRPPDGKTRA